MIHTIHDGIGTQVTIPDSGWWVCPRMGTYNVAGRPTFFMAGDRISYQDSKWVIEFDSSNAYRFKLDDAPKETGVVVPA